MYTNYILSLILLFCSCKSKPDLPKTEVALQSHLNTELSMPEGFVIEPFATDVENARSMSISPSGVVYVGNRGGDKVYALVDLDGDFKVDQKHVIMEGGNMPNGVTFHKGDLYVAEVNRILKFENIESKLENPGEPIVVYDGYPTESHHGWKYIEFGPDGKLYVPVGAPCNICESEDPIFNTITRLNSDGTDVEIVHSGIRNTVGFTWHPETKELWFTDNNRDRWGDDKPACELNKATKDGLHFGYPYCHQGDLLDDKFGEGKDCNDYVAPVQNVGPHSAPLGVKFYTGSMFPAKYNNNVAFIAEHGSWNRSKKIGYQISIVILDESHNAIGYEPFISGWLDEASQDVTGRPVDIEWMADGSMLISDDYADMIYRVSYQDSNF